jgi:antitoxin component HigA of HigAB toxin-antitoxin module
MEKKFENVSELTTREEYDNAMSYVVDLINNATAEGALSDPEADNEYIREIGRVGHLCAGYENTRIEFKYINVKKKNPLIKTIEDEMYARSINQKELAKMLSIDDAALSLIIRGKRPISMRIAKKLHKSLNIDAKLLIDYA